MFPGKVSGNPSLDPDEQFGLRARSTPLPYMTTLFRGVALELVHGRSAGRPSVRLCFSPGRFRWS